MQTNHHQGEAEAILEPAVETAEIAEAPVAAAATSKLILTIAIVYVAMNLRPALLSVGPMVDSLRDSLGLSGVALGALITLPVLCFGAFAPFAPRLLLYQPAERWILLNLALLVLGLALRSVLGVVGLFAGTFIVGLSISVVMVMLPSIIKRNFSTQAGMMMGLYSTALALGAAIAAGVTVPLEQWLGGWQWALGFWLAPAVLAVAVWWPQTPSGSHDPSQARPALPKLRRSWLAWQVTLFMGFQGAIAYSVFGWLPLILIDRGMTPMDGGLVLSVTMFVQLSSSLAGPWIATRGRDQRATIMALMVLVLVGFLLLVYGSIQWIYLWAAVFGLGFGGMFSLAMALLVWRSPNSLVAASLSGMSQGVGYTLAAIAPLIVGILHDLTGDWNAVTVFMVVLVIGAMWSGVMAGRAKFIEVGSTLG